MVRFREGFAEGKKQGCDKGFGVAQADKKQKGRTWPQSFGLQLPKEATMYGPKKTAMIGAGETRPRFQQ
jgi:hypothetical protein